MSERANKTENKHTRWRRRLQKAILLGGALLVSLLAVELGLRWLHFTDPSSFYIYDHDRAHTLRPWAEGWWNQEGGNYQRINSRGWHDREHSLAKSPGTLRIAVLGDSYAEALHVPLESAFWAEAERKLQGCPNTGGRKVEVLNFGVSGYGTAQELITLRSQVWQYSPDIVLLAFTAGNDVNDNFKPLSSDPTRPYFVLQNGELKLDRSTLDTIESSRWFWLRHSVFRKPLDRLSDLRIIQLAIAAARVIRARTKSNSSQTKGTDTIPNKEGSGARRSSESGLDNLLYFEPTDKDWSEAWRVTEALLSQINAEVKARGADFYVVTLTSAVQVSPRAEDYAATVKALGLKDLFYPDFRITALGQSKGFPVLNLAPELQKFAQQQNVYIHGFGSEMGSGHWNEIGHRAAGDRIAQWMCSELGRPAN